MGLEVPQLLLYQPHMLSYTLMRVFDHTVMHHREHHTLSTLHHQVLAVGALWDDNTKNTKQTFHRAVLDKRQAWFEGLWVNVGEPTKFAPNPSNS